MSYLHSILRKLPNEKLKNGGIGMCEYKVVGDTFPVNMMCESTALCNKEPLRAADRRNQVIYLFFLALYANCSTKDLTLYQDGSG